ncbi:MAG TPA: hypothetical protein GXX75_05080 [Clostridiales bacterium]|nr:hypothetical protein [Clostridiales bacterium]
MKRAIKIILLIIGILLILAFFITIAYDYYLMKTRIFAVPLGIQFTIMLSSILFFIPGVICLIAAYFLRIRRRETN